MSPRVRLEIGWLDLAFGMGSCLLGRDRETRERPLEEQWSGRGDGLVSFSVRTDFDLLLQALALPQDSEILFTALNIKGMVKIARRHGLVAVPVDLDPTHMRADLASAERAITPATLVIVVAPLFGTRGDLLELAQLARRHGLLVVEDAAQAFAGLAYSGHPAADVTLFSFGPLKFATALGGALLRVRNPQLCDQMRKIQSSSPVQTTRLQLGRLLKFAALKRMTNRAVMGALVQVLRLGGRDYEDAVAEPARGVAKLGSTGKIRKRCGAPLLALLQRRLEQWRPDPGRVRAAAILREELEGCVRLPAIGDAFHSHWAFPIVVDEPQRVLEALRSEGFDAATLGRSTTVAAPPDRPELDPMQARRTLEKLVVLPCYAAMPDAELRRQAAVIRRVVAA